MFVVGRVFSEVVAGMVAEELVEDVDAGSMGEDFVAVAAVFVGDAGWAVVGSAGVTD